MINLIGEKQLWANRENARKSTGPKTPAVSTRYKFTTKPIVRTCPVPYGESIKMSK
jgi:hypothetical protein